MKTTRLSPDERAVSPVIGVILMVAVTVILAAVIGAFSFETFDRDSNPAPATSFDYDYEGTDLTITHAAGDGFRGTTVTFKCTGTCSATMPTDWSDVTDVRAGDTITLSGVSSDDTIRIVWTDPREDDTTAVLGKWEGPNA